MSNASKELTFAIDICKQVAELALDHLKKGIEVVTKSDGTPVTKADQECERLIRNALAREFPDDAILGEEEGGSFDAETSGRRTWIIDPIDGTSNFVRGVPFFATLLALYQDGHVRVGIVNAPATGEMYYAQTGGGAFKNGKRIKVSDISDLSKAQLNVGELKTIQTLGIWKGFESLVSQTNRQRGYGDYLSLGQVFEGKAEMALEAIAKPWDIAPMKVLAEESGGKYTDMEGGQSVFKGGCFVSNGHLHDIALDILLSKRKPQFDCAQPREFLQQC